MHSLLIYLMKVIICSGLFYIYYRWALRDKNFHSYNRFYLLTISGLSILLPLIQLSWFDVSTTNQNILAMMQALYGNNLPDIVVTDKPSIISWSEAALFISLGITLIIICIQIYRIGKIYRLKKNYPVQRIENIDFINTNLQDAPFSFMQNLFWRSDIRLDEKVGKQIYQHEMIHIQQKHSIDKIFIQILKALFWMNPFYYFIEKEMLLIHEYIADRKAIGSNDGAAFAKMLLHSKLSDFQFEPAHPLFYSTIKKRLFMITNSKKPRYSYLRRLLVLPLLGIVSFAFALRAHHYSLKQNEIQLKELISTNKFSSVNLDSTPNQIKTVTFKTISDTVKLQDVRVVNLKNNVADNTDNQVHLQLRRDSDTTPKKWERTIQYRYTPVDSTQSVKHQPLVIVNGEVADYNAIKTTNPNDIESINVLKDASAVNTYGEQGKNGVIMITLKDPNKKVVVQNNSQTSEKIFYATTQSPSFPGGEAGWKAYLEKNLRSNIPAKNHAPVGEYTITVSFLINTLGEISEVTAVDAPEKDYGAGAEAVRVIKESGHWNPATQNGHLVTYREKQKVTFTVNK